MQRVRVVRGDTICDSMVGGIGIICLNYILVRSQRGLVLGINLSSSVALPGGLVLVEDLLRRGPSVGRWTV
jgi:hypothetical protein